MVHAGAAQADRAGVLHEQQVPGARASRARPFLQRRDDDQVGWAALLVGEPLALGGGQLRRNPVRAVDALDLSHSADAEAKRPAVAGPGDVGGLARHQAATLCPAAKQSHGGRQLVQVSLHHPLQALGTSLPPRVEVRLRQPAKSNEHVDCADVLLLGEGRLSRPHDTLLKIGAAHAVPFRAGAHVSRLASSANAWRSDRHSSMKPDVMLDDELLGRVRELRAAGQSPKQIARTLGVRPATVAPLLRTIAQQAKAAEPEPAVVGCWVSPGWSKGLSVDGHKEWPDITGAVCGVSGIVCVAVARRHRPQRVSVCGYLVDVYCLGVKDALGPWVMNDRDLPGFLRKFFGGFEGGAAPIVAPLDLARHLVWGAIDYARRLGFEPAPDFQPAAGHLGPWQETSDITFGRNGVPFYLQGPYDDPTRVVRTLNRSVGDGNFHFIAVTDAVGGR